MKPRVFLRDSQFEIKNVLSRVSYQRFLLDILSSSFCFHVIHQLTISNVSVVACKASLTGKSAIKKEFHYRSRDQWLNHVATGLLVWSPYNLLVILIVILDMWICNLFISTFQWGSLLATQSVGYSWTIPLCPFVVNLPSYPNPSCVVCGFCVIDGYCQHSFM